MKRFLSQWRSYWDDFWRGGKRQKLAAVVQPEELLARFLVHKKKYFSIEERCVKRKAFMPSPDGETSVFRIDGLSEPQIWRTGLKFVSQPQGKPLYGRGDIVAVNVTSMEGLSVAPDDDPPRHACIVGWPADESEQLSIAQELAARATLQLRPE